MPRISQKQRVMLAAGLVLLALVLAAWLSAHLGGPSRGTAPFAPGGEEQREVRVGGETVDLDELERTAREADAVARQLEAELGGLQLDEAASR